VSPSERERVVAFLWATDRAVAGAVTAAAVTDAGGGDCGTRAWAVSDRRCPLLWDANYLYVESLGRAGAAELAAAARELDAVGGMSAGVVAAEEHDGDRLAEPFAQLGWRAAPLLLMAHRDARRLEPGDGVRRLRDEDAAAARRAVILAEDWGNEAVADQVLRRAALIADATRGESYGATRDGAVASTCVLLRRDGLAQVDDVGTLPAARRHGLARAVVSFATEQGRADSELVFLCADALDWPRHLYERLGYEAVGLLHRYFPVLPLL
jgi:ribosomal protein S18 acetylase RimI-like enzyme